MNQHQNDSDSNSDEEKPKKRGWFIEYGPKPTPDQCRSDDEVSKTNYSEYYSHEYGTSNNFLNCIFPKSPMRIVILYFTYNVFSFFFSGKVPQTTSTK